MNEETLTTLAKQELLIYSGIQAQRNQRDRARWAAAAAIHQAIKAAKIPKAAALKCRCCSGQAAEYHHHNGYSEAHWLDVIPLCVTCHRRIELAGWDRCQGHIRSGEPCGKRVSPTSGGYCFDHLFQRFTPLEIRLAREVVILKEKLESVCRTQKTS